MSSKLWEKNFEINKEIERFTVGRDREMDMYLAKYDVLGSMAHITMLESIGLLEKDELATASFSDSALRCPETRESYSSSGKKSPASSKISCPPDSPDTSGTAGSTGTSESTGPADSPLPWPTLSVSVDKSASDLP